MSDLIELKSTIEKLGGAWAEFKKTNDELLQAKADGKAVGEIQVKLDAISADIDKFAETKQMIEDFMAKSAAPGVDPKSAQDLDVEVKGFNLMMRAEFQSKGKAAPSDLDADNYKQYKSGFFKIATGVPIDSLSADERKAMVAGSDPDGGYLLPHSTVGMVVKKVYELSVMRQICNVQTIGTDKIEGLIDNDEASAGWVSEIGARPETGTPQLGKWEIQCHELYAAPKASQKLIDDASVNVEDWIANKVAEKFARIEGLAFWRGSGVGQPRGLAMYPTADTGDDTRAWGVFQHVLSGANGAFGSGKADPMQDLLGAFKDAYLVGASFVMRREVRTLIRKFKAASDERYLWEPSLQMGQPDRLLGYPTRIDQFMPVLAAGSLSLAFGDFKEAYTIADRIGMRTLRDPYTAKPYVVFYSTKRVGGGATNFEAVKFLKFAAA